MEKSHLKFRLLFMLTCLNFFLKKSIHVKITLKNLFTETKIKHTPSGYSLFPNFSFDETKNKLDCYKGEDCMERFCKDIKDHAMKIINYQEEEMIPLTDKGTKSYEK